jgi:hypothetical protein
MDKLLSLGVVLLGVSLVVGCTERRTAGGVDSSLPDSGASDSAMRDSSADTGAEVDATTADASPDTSIRDSGTGTDTGAADTGSGGDACEVWCMEMLARCGGTADCSTRCTAYPECTSLLYAFAECVNASASPYCDSLLVADECTAQENAWIDCLIGP